MNWEIYLRYFIVNVHFNISSTYIQKWLWKYFKSFNKKLKCLLQYNVKFEYHYTDVNLKLSEKVCDVFRAIKWSIKYFLFSVYNLDCFQFTKYSLQLKVYKLPLPIFLQHWCCFQPSIEEDHSVQLDTLCFFISTKVNRNRKRNRNIF